tara:strand:- start:591 stop:1316 length:726 start_codon:yes stop_codon:yes gene_type:complete
MQKEPIKWFQIITGNALVYNEPTFDSQCITEAVLGETCTIISEHKNWLNIKCEDGYKGWINKFYGEYKTKISHPKYIIVYPDKRGCYNPLYPFGAMLNKKLPGSIEIDNNLGYDSVIPIARNLLGVPYRWGGKTSNGIDCSGLVQTVLKICGIDIPRDSYQQRDYFSEFSIKVDEAQPGDLHFFGYNKKITHVAFSTGGRGVIHANGYVKEESLNSDHKNSNISLQDIYLSSYSIRRNLCL